MKEVATMDMYDGDYDLCVALQNELGTRRSVVVHKWHNLLVSAGICSVSLGVLFEVFDDIIRILCLQPFDLDQAYLIGERLSDLYGEKPSLLGATHQLLSDMLVEDLSTEVALPLQERLVVLFGVCISVFVTHLQETYATTPYEPLSQLHMVEHCLNAIAGHVSLFVFVLDTHQVFRYVHGKALKLLNLVPDEVLGQSLIDIIPDTDMQHHVHCTLQGESFVAMMELSGVVLEVRYEPLRDEHGVIDGVIGVAHNVTRSVHLEETIRKLTRSVANTTCMRDLKTERHHVSPLSERELEVLHYVARGMTNREIAKKLVISHSTVKWHLENIFAKLGVRSRAAAVRSIQSIYPL